MNNKIDEVLELTREISLQDNEEDIDFSVTEFGVVKAFCKVS